MAVKTEAQLLAQAGSVCFSPHASASCFLALLLHFQAEALIPVLISFWVLGYTGRYTKYLYVFHINF